MARNYLKSFKGENQRKTYAIKHKANFVRINLLLAASAFNLKKWMNVYFYAFFIQDFTLILVAMTQINIIRLQIYKLSLLKNY